LSHLSCVCCMWYIYTYRKESSSVRRFWLISELFSRKVMPTDSRTRDPPIRSPRQEHTIPNKYMNCKFRVRSVATVCRR
jgi:hypothetical protein